MTLKGIAKGRTIELDKPLPYRNGQEVQVSIEPLTKHPLSGSPSSVLDAVDGPPHLSSEAVDELLRVIEEGRRPVRSVGVFEA